MRPLARRGSGSATAAEVAFGVDPRIVGVRRRWRPGTSPCAAGGRGSRSRWATPLSPAGRPSQPALERANPHVFNAKRSERKPSDVHWMRRAQGADGYLLEAFDFVQCLGAGITRSGGAVPQTLPVAAVAHGCLIDRFASWPYQCVTIAALPFCALRCSSLMAKYCSSPSVSSQN